MPDDKFIADMMARGELAVEEVRRDCGYDAEEPWTAGQQNEYIEKLESKVREQAMTLFLAARTPIEARRVGS